MLPPERVTSQGFVRYAGAMARKPKASKSVGVEEIMDTVKRAMLSLEGRPVSLDDYHPGAVAGRLRAPTGVAGVYRRTESGTQEAAPEVTLEDAIAVLYVREINCGCETFWDGGIKVWIGDGMNGHKSETVFSRHRMGLTGQWLVDEAARLYPGAFQ
jgi:hypothetical protein